MRAASPNSAQILLQILVAIVFFLLLAGTYLFRMGLIGKLTKYFKPILIVSLVYFAVTMITGVYRTVRLLESKASGAQVDMWEPAYHTMSIIQKLGER